MKIAFFNVTGRGFTLIELMISLTIIMLVGTVMIIVFFSALRGADRSQSLIIVRQNGEFALSQIARSVRHAEAITNYQQCSAAGGASTLEISSGLDHKVTTFSCSATNIASASANGTFYLLDNSQVAPFGSCRFTCGREPTTQLPLVTVSFTLGRTAGTQSDAVVRPVDFTTTILLRNADEF